MERRRFSNSEMTTFRRCRRKWWLSQYRRLKRATVDPSGPLKSGSRVHAALEVYYVPDGSEPGDAMGALEAAAAADKEAYMQAVTEMGMYPDKDVLEAFEEDCKLERIMVQGYFEWLEETGADAGLSVIVPEQTLEVIDNDLLTDEMTGRFAGLAPWKIVGKLDVQMRRESDGAVLFMDHKTAKSLTRGVEMLNSNRQMLHYHLLQFHNAMNSDDLPQGAIYNMLRKTKRSSRSKPPYYAREFVIHNQTEIDSYRLAMLGTIADMLEVEANLNAGVDPLNTAYPNPTPDCTWDCDFVNVCSMFDDGSRVEQAINDQFTEGDPMERYKN